MFLYEKTHRYLKNDYQFFDALKTKDRNIRGNCNLLTKVKFHELDWTSPLIDDPVIIFDDSASLDDHSRCHYLTCKLLGKNL